MQLREITSRVDHTLLAPESTWPQIRQLCDEAVQFRTASVCIPPSFVQRASAYLAGRMAVGTVIGFPGGYATTETKTAEAENAVKNGADELDMVIDIGALKEGSVDYVARQIRAVRHICTRKILKVIIETCLLTEPEKLTMCRIVRDTGADFIKTSTGFSSGGATFDDVALLVANVGPDIRVKASGGIGSLEDAERFVKLGAQRLGTSRVIRLLKVRSGS